jgi:hypothetical protein
MEMQALDSWNSSLFGHEFNETVLQYHLWSVDPRRIIQNDEEL